MAIVIYAVQEDTSSANTSAKTIDRQYTFATQTMEIAATLHYAHRGHVFV